MDIDRLVAGRQVNPPEMQSMNQPQCWVPPDMAALGAWLITAPALVRQWAIRITAIRGVRLLQVTPKAKKPEAGAISFLT